MDQTTTMESPPRSIPSHKLISGAALIFAIWLIGDSEFDVFSARTFLLASCWRSARFEREALSLGFVLTYYCLFSLSQSNIMNLHIVYFEACWK